MGTPKNQNFPAHLKEKYPFLRFISDQNLFNIQVENVSEFRSSTVHTQYCL